jgi:hypothetical protein
VTKYRNWKEEEINLRNQVIIAFLKAWSKKIRFRRRGEEQEQDLEKKTHA